MTNKEFNDLMLNSVLKVLDTQKIEMGENLLANINPTSSLDEKYARMLCNAVTYSVTKSVECMLDICEEIGVINPHNIQMSPETLSALKLRLLK